MSILDTFFNSRWPWGITLTWRFCWTGWCKKMGKWKFFSDKEVEGLKDELIVKLDKARGVAGFPFVITSGLRSSEENQSIPGAVQDSSHLSGLAVDVRVLTSGERFDIVMAVLACGFRRVGIYDKHIHVDCDRTKPQGMIWLGTSH